MFDIAAFVVADTGGWLGTAVFDIVASVVAGTAVFDIVAAVVAGTAVFDIVAAGTAVLVLLSLLCRLFTHHVAYPTCHEVAH